MRFICTTPNLSVIQLLFINVWGGACAGMGAAVAPNHYLARALKLLEPSLDLPVF